MSEEQQSELFLTTGGGILSSTRSGSTTWVIVGSATVVYRCIVRRRMTLVIKMANEPITGTKHTTPPYVCRPVLVKFCCGERAPLIGVYAVALLQLVLRADARRVVVTAATTTTGPRRLIYLPMPGFRCPRVLTNGLYIRRTSGLITGPSGRSPPPPRLYKPKDCISTKRNGIGYAVGHCCPLQARMIRFHKQHKTRVI